MRMHGCVFVDGNMLLQVPHRHGYPHLLGLILGRSDESHWPISPLLGG